MSTASRTTLPREAAPGPLVAAAIAGLVHAAISLYWGCGGTWLLSTVGTRMLEAFAGHHWLLLPVAVLKGGFALFPVAMASCRLLRRTGVRVVCWLGAIVLVAWGALGMVVANLVLVGAIGSRDGMDRPGMIGHAWLWDPLFLAWGLLLVWGLLGSRSRRA